MTQPNPYDSPRVPQAATTHLARKARRLLERRDEPITLLCAMGNQWQRHLAVAIVFAVLCGIAWRIGDMYLFIGLSAFWFGRLTRDLQWYRTMVLEWESTKELLDWEKIQRLAR